jgi:hypothetical protein
MQLMLALFLAAHGLIHASYLSPAPPRTAGGPEWPFELTQSWLVTGLQLDAVLVRGVGIGLVVASAVLLVLAGLSTAGWIVPQSWWSGLTLAGAATSLGTLLLFFHPWLALGLVIDLGLVWLVVGAGWSPSRIGT